LHFRSNGGWRKRSAGTNVSDSATDSAGLGKQGIYRTDDVQYKENNGLLKRFWYVIHKTIANDWVNNNKKCIFNYYFFVIIRGRADSPIV